MAAMIQRFAAHAQYTCPKCDKPSVSTVEVPEPNWGEAESSSDLQSEGPTEVICPNCGAEFSAYAYNNAGNCQIILDDFPETRLHTDIAMFEPPQDDWLIWDFPQDPYQVFNNTFYELVDLLETSGSEDCSGLASGSPLINRMVFAQLVSALEAYLGDTLMLALTKKPDGLAKLISADRDLNQQKFTLLEIFLKPNLVQEHVSAYLKEAVIYHNIPKVDFLYNHSLGVTILEDREANIRLLEAVKLRHDCVHRNGKGKDGAPIRLFTMEYVKDIAMTIRSLVDRVDRRVWGDRQFWEMPF